MTDKYGDLPLPIPAPSAGSSVADPILDTLVSFFASVIASHGGVAWAAIAPGTGNVVKSVFTHNPSEAAFKLISTPAIYLWRDQIYKARQIAADWRIRPSRLIFRWVPFPVYQQERSRRWDPFFNAIPSILDAAVELGRDPSWVIVGDPDPEAATRGSLLWTYAPFHKLEIAREEVKRAQLDIPVVGEGTQGTYEVLDIPIELEERLVRDPATNAEIAYAQVTVQTAGLTTNTGQFTFDPD